MPDPEAMSPAARDERVLWVIAVEGTANATMSIVKAAIGVHTGSIALVTDAVHSATDLANNVVAWVVTRWSARPADAGHPYGHRKFETLAVAGLGALLVIAALELGGRALRPDRAPVATSVLGLAGVLAALAGNVALATWQGRWARRLDSEILRADARHTLADVLTTTTAIVGWQAAARGVPWADRVAALLGAALILVLAFGLFRRALPALVDAASIPAERIREIAGAVPGVRGVASPRSRWVGARAEVDLIVWVDAELSTRASHQIATAVETALRDATPVDRVTVHVEPEPAPHAGGGD